MNKRIYLDHAATTDMLPEVSYAMEPYFVKKFGNASTAYEPGEEARHAMEAARKEIAACINAKPEEIFFTSGGSESDNWAVKSIAGYRKHIGSHILTSKIEHHAILHSCEYLENLDYKVTYLDVDKDGIVDMKQMKMLMEKGKESKQKENRVTLVSVMYGNNEIGTIEPIEEICHVARRHDVYVHTDAVQAIGQIPISVKKLPVDMLSASAHKFHGPKGVGFLYVREGLDIPSFIHGGAQEKGKRAGTENIAGIVGMAKALSIANKQVGRKRRELTHLRNYFAKRIMQEIPDVYYNGHPAKRLPGNLNFSFRGVNGTALLVLLEEEGILASAGSACSTGTARVSHVIEAIGVPKDYAYGTLRFSMGRQTNKKDIDKTIEVLKQAVELLRQGG
uniref:cysteine desulfurase family protein n=1 Tax=Agathobacter sp. TaxID=2021311 RepID=UPI004057626C